MTTTTDKLAEALRALFDNCAMVHKYWGENSNAKQASEAEQSARAALSAYDAERATNAREPAGAHTPEPWLLREVESSDSDGLVPAIDGANRERIADAEPYYPKAITRENARRIVACVNACAGIPTETLEAMNAREAGLLRSAVRLVVKLEGGLVQWIGSDGRAPVEVAVIDYDDEGADDDECAEIPQDGGGTARAVARIETADDSDPEWIAHAFDAINAADFIEEWQTRPEPEGGDE